MDEQPIIDWVGAEEVGWWQIQTRLTKTGPWNFYVTMGPRSTRLTAVVDFSFWVDLVMITSVERDRHLDEHQVIAHEEEPRVHFTSLSATARPGGVEEVLNDGYMVLLSFWLDEFTKPVHTIDIPIPLSWSPRTYLAALQLNIKRTGVVMISPDNFVGPLAPTLNEVHWLFNLDIEDALSILERQNVFENVNGGECFVITT